jgi:hypothetical protein
MRAIIFYLFSFALVAQAVAADFFHLPSHPPFTNTISARAQELLGTLEPGMTRAQLERHFIMDGGGQSVLISRYYLDDQATDSTVIMFEVSFRPAGMDAATWTNPQKRAGWFQAHRKVSFQPSDVVISVWTPYISSIHYD